MFYSNRLKKKLFSDGGTVSNKRAIMWKNDIQKLSTKSELYFVFCFILITCLGEKKQI